ncbi:hypothetical protein AK812_SmicGene22955 [Symbiodinium microadriaticum]|uniref:Reverse transcriptase domain-containing protein n=1 Tax=Symbiodinium microadriaticum TaxID=2951 RepID=A0A1Q9DIL0_SYMMI|nr:hypothetical protein AK812_SmicGene22955 [Symbiodinium microadriaticum]
MVWRTPCVVATQTPKTWTAAHGIIASWVAIAAQCCCAAAPRLSIALGVTFQMSRVICEDVGGTPEKERANACLAVHLLSFSLDSMIVDTILFNTLLSACGRGNLRQNGILLEYAKSQFLHLLISACERGSKWQVALECLQDGLEAGLEPTLVTVSAGVSAMEKGSQWQSAVELVSLSGDASIEADISKDTSFCYIGSTNLTVAKREYNRVAELKQLKQLKLPKTEIAIRYWHDKQNSELFSTLLLSKHTEYIDAWAEEHSLIQRWQPKLNYPFVTKELVKKAHGLVPARQQPHLQKPPDTLAKQLFKKIRRRLQGQKRRLVNALPKQAQFWKILYAISSDTKQEYNASRELRIGKHDNETVTLLYRLANHMEHPGALRLPHKVDIGNPSRASVKNFYANIPALNNIKEVHELFRANEEQPDRELVFLNHDLVGFFNSIPQADIIQSVRYLITEFSKNNNDILLIDPHSKLNPVHSGSSTHNIKSNMTKINVQHIVDVIQFSFDACAFTAIGEVFRQTCGTSMGNQISPILSTCAIVATEITWLRLFGQHVASAHLADQLWIRRYVDNRAIIVDKDVLHNNPHIWQLASLHFYKKPVQLEDENCDDFLGFRINENNRLPSELLRASALTRRGAPAMVFSVGAYYHAGSVGIRSNTRKYPCVSALPAYMIRACTHSNFSAVSLLHNVNMATHVDRYNQPGSTNVLVRSLNAQLKPVERSQHPCSIPAWTYTDGWSSELPVADDSIHARTCLQLCSYNISHLRMFYRWGNKFMCGPVGSGTKGNVIVSLACDMHIQRIVNETPEIIAYTILEVTFDLRALVHLAQTNKATWIRCSQILRATSTECKIQTNAPWHKRAGRAVDAQATETPIDIKMCLFNKRMHTWYHHELSYQQYMDLQVRELLPAP